MARGTVLRIGVALAVFAALQGVLTACDALGGSSKLKPGLNYMQPIKWRLTMRYRVQEIIPSQPVRKGKPSAFDPDIPTVGKGTYEVWLAQPYEGESMLNVKQTFVHPQPTKVATDPQTGAVFNYWDFAPDGYLPRELDCTVTYELITMEQYAMLNEVKPGAYDTKSDLYKRYTKLGKPFTYNPGMADTLRLCQKDNKGDPLETSRQAYNYMSKKFDYAFDQGYMITLTGLAGMTDAYRAWENQSGQCDEIANVYITMLRKMGIPCRPVVGIAHYPEQLGANGDYALAGDGHAWVEVWIEDLGWVPVDPTWGTNEEVVPPMLTLAGAVQGLQLQPAAAAQNAARQEDRDVERRLRRPPQRRGARDLRLGRRGVGRVQRAGLHGLVPQQGLGGLQLRRLARDARPTL
jgi:hypothetical protein